MSSASATPVESDRQFRAPTVQVNRSGRLVSGELAVGCCASLVCREPHDRRRRLERDIELGAVADAFELDGLGVGEPALRQRSVADGQPRSLSVPKGGCYPSGNRCRARHLRRAAATRLLSREGSRARQCRVDDRAGRRSGVVHRRCERNRGSDARSATRAVARVETRRPPGSARIPREAQVGGFSRNALGRAGAVPLLRPGQASLAARDSRPALAGQTRRLPRLSRGRRRTSY